MNINEKLFDFIEKSPTAYHTVASVKERLIGEGYEELSIGKPWELVEGGKYFTVKNGSSIIAFRNSGEGFMIVASHSDSPSFRVKRSEKIVGAYTRLDVEKYGGMIYYSWLDRPLSVAGRVLVKSESGIESRLVNIDRDIAVIPSVAIHMNRSVNDGFKFNPASDLLPLISKDSSESLSLSLCSEIGVSKEDVISHDLFLYTRTRGTKIGIGEEFILAPRLDDLACAYASLEAFLNYDVKDSTPVLAIFDNEEVGSETKQGAASTFLFDTLKRISKVDRESDF